MIGIKLSSKKWFASASFFNAFNLWCQSRIKLFFQSFRTEIGQENQSLNIADAKSEISSSLFCF